MNLPEANNPEEQKQALSRFKMAIRDMPAEYRPQNRLINEGITSLSTPELLAVIIKSGSQQENVINLSQRILSQYNLKQLSVTTVTQLMGIDGIKEGNASQIAACFEIARRLESFNEA